MTRLAWNGPRSLTRTISDLPLREIGDARIARHRQGRMRGRDRRHVEDFAIGGQPAVKIVAVPGRQAFGAVVAVFLGHVQPSGDRIRPADPEGAAASRHRLAGLDDARAGRHAVFRIKPVGELAGGAAWASVRQAPATAANRAARQNCSPEIVPIVPKYHHVWRVSLTAFLPKPQGHPHSRSKNVARSPILRYNVIVGGRRQKCGIAYGGEREVAKASAKATPPLQFLFR